MKNEKVSVYRFPVKEEERKKWIRAIPLENLYVNNNSRVCRYHWSLDCKSFISYRDKEKPTEPPFVFDVIPASCLSSPAPELRKSVFASCTSRNVIPDEVEQIREADNLVYSDVIEKVRNNYDLIVFEKRPEIIIQSKECRSGIPKYLLTHFSPVSHFYSS